MAEISSTILNPGKHFYYNGIEFICLDIIDGNYLAITAKSYTCIPFNVDYENDWRKSSLRRVLNTDFLDSLDRRWLVKQTSDLVAENGDKAYGTSEDYITILSINQYLKYHDLVPLIPNWQWTCTPWVCQEGLVICISSSGKIIECNSFVDIGVLPVCLFSSKTLELYHLSQLIKGDKDDK